MKAEEIRKKFSPSISSDGVQGAKIFILREIAAQLADLNTNLVRLEVTVRTSVQEQFKVGSVSRCPVCGALLCTEKRYRVDVYLNGESSSPYRSSFQCASCYSIVATPIPL